MNTFETSKEFVFGKDLDWETCGEGVKRKIMAYDNSIMLVKVHFESGGVGPVHEHYHAQTTYVVSGKFDLTIGDKTHEVKTGDAFYIPPHKWHGAVCTESGVLIDVFSPIREDFME